MTRMRGNLPVDAAAREEIVDLFGALLDTGHTIEESLRFIAQLAWSADVEMNLSTVLV